MDSVNTSLKISLRRKWCGLHKVQLSVVKAGYSARYRICTGYAQLAQISKRCSTCIHVAAV